MKRIISAICIIAAVAATYFCSNTSSGKQPIPITGNMLSVIIENGQPAHLIHYHGMDVSFNPDAHIPNWVAWELNSSRVNGSEPRNDNFEADTKVGGCPTPGDYKFSGYDRGHMAPAADMKWNKKAMSESFYLTNVAPQTHALNNGAWKRLEEKCRQWAMMDSVLYIVCGPVLTDELTERIGATGVAVPQRFFKVIVAPYADPPRGIGFIMPNGAVKGGMQQAACSIDEVEAITGLDFFAALPDTIENAVERQCNFNQWSNRGR